MGKDDLRVGEMFAGVGGFRLGLEGAPSKDWETEFLKFEETGFKVVWSNQWEPGSSKQWASKIYEERFGSEGHTNEDIHDIAFNEGEMKETIREQIPELDVLVGGFPCQDYSVARTISGELGIKGEKGKLWIPIRNIIRHKRSRPKVVLLENVPRLLNSPANARGLNFSIILNDLLKEGYHVEWRVINAADYGMPQQRSRVFILAYRTSGAGKNYRVNGTEHFGCKASYSRGKMSTWMLGWKGNSNWSPGPFAEKFPCIGELRKRPEVVPPLDYRFTTKSSPFGNAGYAWKARIEGGKSTENRFWTTKVKPDFDGERITLGDVLEDRFDKKYEVDASRIDEWNYAKGNKNEFRIRKSDRDNVDPELLATYDLCMTRPFAERAGLWSQHRPKFMAEVGDNKFYRYDEGTMGLDSTEKASRTVVTAEIGSSPSRMRHIFEDSPGRFRRLSPMETERLNMFPDNWTKMNDEKGKEIPDSKRGFMMGNALVVGIIQRLREPIGELIRRRRSI